MNHIPHMHVLRRSTIVWVREASKRVRMSHLGAHRLRWDVSVATNHVAVCFCHARRLALVSVVRRNLCVRRQDARMSAVRTTETIIGIDIGRIACVWCPGVAQLLGKRFTATEEVCEKVSQRTSSRRQCGKATGWSPEARCTGCCSTSEAPSYGAPLSYCSRAGVEITY